ncbi:hypothetical protein ACX0GZ_00145 [Sphingomonas aestuarii]
MRIDLRAKAFPGLLEAVGLAVIHFDAMERAIPSVFRAALNVSTGFQRNIFTVTRGLDTHLKLAEAAVEEGAADFLDRWRLIAKRVRSLSELRGKVAHSGISIYGGGVIVDLDEDGKPTGILRRAGPPTASLLKSTRGSSEQISEKEVRQLAADILVIEGDIRQLAADITASRPPPSS